MSILTMCKKICREEIPQSSQDYKGWKESSVGWRERKTLSLFLKSENIYSSRDGFCPVLTFWHLYKSAE